jgi:hypothetical protein
MTAKFQFGGRCHVEKTAPRSLLLSVKLNHELRMLALLETRKTAIVAGTGLGPPLALARALHSRAYRFLEGFN